MAYTNAKDLMTAICDAVREKEGSSELIPHQELPERIRGISGGGGNVSYVLPSFFENLNNDLVKTYNSTDTITCEVGHTYLVFTTYLTGASYADSQYISVTGADILRDASFIMTGSDVGSGTAHNTHMSSFIITATQTNVSVQHRFSLVFESQYQTVITIDITDNVNEITDREMLSVSESNSFQSNAGKYYLVLLGSIVGASPSISTSSEIIYQSNITTGASAYGHLTSIVLMIVKSTSDFVTAFLNSVSSKNALFYMDISNKVSGGGTVVDELKYKIVTVSTGGFDASIKVDNLASSTATEIPYKTVENGSYEDFGDFRISYEGENVGWCLTCTTSMLFVGSAILLEGEKINWLYNKSVEYYVKVRTVQSEPSTPAILITNILEDLAMTDDTWTDSNGNVYEASASSVYASATQCKAYMPFNGTDSYGMWDCWHPELGAPQWLMLKLPNPVKINGFTMLPRESYVESVRRFIFQGSNDGENFTDIFTSNSLFCHISEGNTGASYQVMFQNNNAYLYYRWYIPEVNNYGVISKIRNFVTFETIFVLPPHTYYNGKKVNTSILGDIKWAKGSAVIMNDDTFLQDGYIQLSDSAGANKDGFIITEKTVPLNKYTSVTVTFMQENSVGTSYWLEFGFCSQNETAWDMNGVVNVNETKLPTQLSTNIVSKTIDISTYNSNGQELYFYLASNGHTNIYSIVFNP